jgi:SgrR family transcriptional regulator
MLKVDYAVLFLYHRQLKTQVHPALKGVHLDSLGWVDFRSVWFEHQKHGRILSMTIEREKC